MNYTTLHEELNTKLLIVERLVDKLAADLAEVSFRGAELEFDILYTNRNYLQPADEFLDAPEADVAAEDGERIG